MLSCTDTEFFEKLPNGCELRLKTVATVVPTCSRHTSVKKAQYQFLKRSPPIILDSYKVVALMRGVQIDAAEPEILGVFVKSI